MMLFIAKEINAETAKASPIKIVVFLGIRI
jgi:hypothetical protein